MNNPTSPTGPTEMIHCEPRDSFAVVTITGKDENNTLDMSAAPDLNRIFTELKSRMATRTVILTAAGDQVFSTGADVTEMSAFTPEQAREFARAWHALITLIGDLGKPVIAAVNGLA